MMKKIVMFLDEERAQTTTEFIFLLALVLLIALSLGIFLKNFLKRTEIHKKIQSQIQELQK